MKHEKKCVCTDKDPYTCYYERYLEVFHKKYPDEGEEPEVEDVLFTDVTVGVIVTIPRKTKSSLVKAGSQKMISAQKK
jgi:hypothetical protein